MQGRDSVRLYATAWCTTSRLRWLVFVIASAIAIAKLLRADTDFGIYLRAAEELAHTDLDVYRSHEQHGAYGYPHWVLLLLLPVVNLPEPLVRIGFGLLQGLATVWILFDVHRIVRKRIELRAWHWLVFGLLFARWFSSNYTAGQFSLWVAALTIRGIAELDGGRIARGGIMIGAAAAAKLTPLAFLVALPLMGFASAAVWMAGTVVALVFLVPWPVLGSSEHARHLHEFYQAMLAPLFGTAQGDAAMWAGTSASIKSTMQTLLQQSPESDAIRTNLCDLPDATLRIVSYVYSAAVLVLAAFAFFAARKHRAALVMQSSVVIITMALFSPLTRSYHCAMLALAGMWFVAEPKPTMVRRLVWSLIAAAFAFGMILRQKSLLGRDLWSALDRCGLVHFGIVGMLVLLAVPAREKA